MSDLPGPEKPPPVALPALQLIPPELLAGAVGRSDIPAQSAPIRKHRLSQRQKMVLMLAACGWRGNEIARELGYTPARVSVILNSQRSDITEYRNRFELQVAENTLDVNLKLKLAAPAATQTMINLMASNDERVRALAAKDILDRAGYAPIRKQLNVDMPVPVEEISRVLGELNKNHEVLMRRDEWEVRKVG